MSRNFHLHTFSSKKGTSFSFGFADESAQMSLDIMSLKLLNVGVGTFLSAVSALGLMKSLVIASKALPHELHRHCFSPRPSLLYGGYTVPIVLNLSISLPPSLLPSIYLSICLSLSLL